MPRFLHVPAKEAVFEGLKEIKFFFNLQNQEQAVEKAIQLALEKMGEKTK